MKRRIISTFFALLFAITSVTALPVASVFAEDTESTAESTTNKCDQQFYASNDVLFYNPCASSCGGGGASSGTISSVHGDNNGEKIFNFWVDAGMSAQQAAGITGSIQHESGFSPFRQEMSQTWPAGGWGIAQFTWDPGQRGNATKFVRDAIGEGLFNQYYKNEYGGGVVESNGFIPEGVPVDVNDKFLLAELNYLLTYINSFEPSTNSTRTGLLSQDFGQSVPDGKSLFDYLKSVVQAKDVAIAWTYLYEFPGNIKSTATARGESASDIVGLYTKGTSTSCGGSLVEGGMSLDEGIAFMNEYKNNPSNVDYIGGAGRDCAGGPLSNCVSFSAYFINKYTTFQGFMTGAPGNGSTVVANVISRNPTVKNGHSPRPYAIFSTPSGSSMCGSVKCGHTGVILGVDTSKGVVIVGEAGCPGGTDWDTAREYPLSQFDSDAYTYAYTDGWMKDNVK